MHAEMMWSPWNGPGLEHLRLIVDDTAMVADGSIIGVDDGRIFRARYRIRCTDDWRVRAVNVTVDASGSLAVLSLRRDAMSRWTTDDGEPLHHLDGCDDIDLSATPFTNTLPIRRLNWHVGTAFEVAMVYIAVPTLSVTATRQRYTCLEALGPNGGRFRFEALGSDFVADLPLDPRGFVLDYPGLFRRVWSA